MSPRATLFVSHGAPDLLTSTSPAREFLSELGASLGRPEAVVVISAHWLTRAPQVDVSERPASLHDFSGFGPELERFDYSAPGAPALARAVAKLLGTAGFAVDEVERGRDHGAWVPLALLWPGADVPAFQVSIQPDLDARHHLDLGRAIAPIREQGVLVLASGGATHDMTMGGLARDGASRAFDDWLVKTVAAGDSAALLDWKRRAPESEQAHPTDDHLLPLFVAFGAAGPGARGKPLHRSVTHGSLRMTAFAFGDEAALASSAGAG